MSEHLPEPDVERIAATTPGPDDLRELPAGTVVLRLHPLTGPHPCAWDEFRHWGPTGSRFDQHPLPPADHPGRGVMYLAAGDEAFTTAIAEYFQDDRGTVGPVDRRRRGLAASAFELAASVQLLDLGSGWVTRAGGNQAICSGPRSASRAWARAIYDEHLTVAGLYYPSSIWGPGRCIALWERGASALPAECTLHRTLADPVLDGPVATAVEALGTITIP